MPQSPLTIDTAETPWVDVYRRLVEIVVPRPIALASTVDAEGRTNLAPFSFFNAVSANPPLIAFSPALAGRTGAKKDTLRNIEQVGQFVVATVTEAIADRANACAAALAPGESEFAHSGLTPLPAERVAASLVAESPVNMECELVEIHRYGSEGGAGNLIVGRILLLHVDQALLDGEGKVRSEHLRAVGRMGGNDWVRTRDTFPMPRP
ncbi:MAG: flavin reductase family protein [Acidobacteria bacterium]|jgi:flavin reductase (DIM6/NTAB) family NADH-FMN oxidoreductase RutF|nr:flavin reductase family protein [Acidobacteriota bacterium]